MELGQKEACSKPTVQKLSVRLVNVARNGGVVSQLGKK
jgi:hypothetical protein